VLVAPAGFGKTTLARQWFQESTRKAAWFRATPAAGDVAALAVGLAETVESVMEGAGERLKERLAMSKAPNSEAALLGAVLAEDLPSWPSETWLVIDEYQHLAAEPAAESFIDTFASHADVPLLVTSRVRPDWATAKHLLYGEVAEFGRNVLAMTHEEAALAAPQQENHAVAGLVALAEGWPAVIGLASLVQSPLVLSVNEMPEALHSYFAEEIFQGIEPQLQEGLVKLSLAPTIDIRLADTLFPGYGRRLLEVAYTKGFLNKDGRSYDLHPLLRQFLRSKLSDLDEAGIRRAAETIARASLERTAWDEAYAIIIEFDLDELFVDLLVTASEDLFATGRLATLEVWIDEARNHIPGEDVIRLVEVELAFRQGRWLEAEDKAKYLARRLPTSHPFASRAIFRAAQVAQLDDRQDEALALLDEARSRSTSTADLRRILWSRFITLSDLEEPERASKALRELEAIPPESIDDIIRLSQAPIHFAVRWGGVRQAMDRHITTLGLLDQTSDPLVRTGFRQSYGTALALAARYEEASDLAELQLAEAERSGLEWVLPHALELKGLSRLGLKDFSSAEPALREAHRLAESIDDYHAQANALALLARIPLSHGDPATALEILEPTRARTASSGMDGELRSIRALVLASMRETDEARVQIQASASLSGHLEARCLRAYAAAIAALADGDEPRCTALLTDALLESSQTGNADSFVTAYRARPEILEVITRTGTLDDFLLRPITSYDAALGAKANLNIRAGSPLAANGLTERETEVLALLKQGLSNREIAHTLWIAESTAKVHVRHIFDKLGVRSRTAAALFRDGGGDPDD